MTCPNCGTPLVEGARFCPACGKASAPTETVNGPLGRPPTADLVGRDVAGRYRIREKLGEGGMGAVYRGEQISLKRAVAVKVLRPDLSSNQTLLKRFNAEAEAIAKLSHPNTVNIYDFGQDTDGSLFIAMEFIEGRSLRTVIGHEAPLSPTRALAIAVQVAASLTDAHAHAIVHRDLKPDNVMLQDRGRHRDVARVLDFGIAKLRDDSRATQQAMTQAGDMLGTPQYMAPEQIKGDPIDGRTDVYALGCMIYEMVTARLPFEAPTILAMLSKHLTESVVPPSMRRPDLGIPPAIDHVVLAAMAKDASARPPTMEQYGEQLAAVLATLPPDPNRPTMGGASAVQGVMSPPPVTPPAMSAFQAPTPAGYAPPTFDQVSPTMAIPPRKGRAGLYAILGVLALGGAGAGIWAATRRSAPSAEPGPGSQHAAGSAEPDRPARPDPWPSQPDPWASNGASPTTGLGTTLEVGQGVKVIVPPELVYQRIDGGIEAVDKSRGIRIVIHPIALASNDPTELANDYASTTGLTLLGIKSGPVNGIARPTAMFEGSYQGVQVIQAVVVFLGESYRIMVAYQLPFSERQNKALLDWGDQFLAQRVILP